jgi:hypothetical protein
MIPDASDEQPAFQDMDGLAGEIEKVEADASKHAIGTACAGAVERRIAVAAEASSVL